MKKKQITPKEKVEKLLGEMRRSYDRWQLLHDHGGSDPAHPDGVNMNLIRNHIRFYKGQIQELCEENEIFLPDEIDRPDPQKVSDNYMARVDEIINHARETLEKYEADLDYQYLIANAGKISEKAAKEICLPAVCGYVYGLRSAIEKNDLVKMRTHENGDRFIDSFRLCAKKLMDIIFNSAFTTLEDGQLSLF